MGKKRNRNQPPPRSRRDLRIWTIVVVAFLFLLGYLLYVKYRVFRNTGAAVAQRSDSNPLNPLEPQILDIGGGVDNTLIIGLVVLWVLSSFLIWNKDRIYKNILRRVKGPKFKRNRAGRDKITLENVTLKHLTPEQKARWKAEKKPTQQELLQADIAKVELSEPINLTDSQLKRMYKPLYNMLQGVWKNSTQYTTQKKEEQIMETMRVHLASISNEERSGWRTDAPEGDVITLYQSLNNFLEPYITYLYPKVK